MLSIPLSMIDQERGAATTKFDWETFKVSGLPKSDAKKDGFLT